MNTAISYWSVLADANQLSNTATATCITITLASQLAQIVKVSKILLFTRNDKMIMDTNYFAKSMR